MCRIDFANELESIIKKGRESYGHSLRLLTLTIIDEEGEKPFVRTLTKALDPNKLDASRIYEEILMGLHDFKIHYRVTVSDIVNIRLYEKKRIVKTFTDYVRKVLTNKYKKRAVKKLQLSETFIPLDIDVFNKLKEGKIHRGDHYIELDNACGSPPDSYIRNKYDIKDVSDIACVKMSLNGTPYKAFRDYHSDEFIIRAF